LATSDRDRPRQVPLQPRDDRIDADRDERRDHEDRERLRDPRREPQRRDERDREHEPAQRALRRDRPYKALHNNRRSVT
jgi:hypothetical protein